MTSLALLATKTFIPPLRPDRVARLRLLQKMDEGMQPGKRLILVSAPAGYGKTILISDWLAQCPCPATWLSLDESDNEIARYLSYLVAALQKICPEAGKTTLVLLQSPQKPSIEALLSNLINDLSPFQEPFVLVQDDFHLIKNRQVHQAVSFLIDHLPPQMRMVIATRADPDLPLARLRAHSQMVELRLADLRFSTQEISEFLNQAMRLKLTETDVAALEASTEGWIAGLQMAALSLQGLADASNFIKSFSGENRYVLDFLFDEVLQRQTGEIQDFLLETSLLEPLCGPLCNAVTGRDDAQATLTLLERANLFLIRLDEERCWYRYHHLFRDLLRSSLVKTYPGRVNALHRRASDWYASADLLEEAIAHAISGRDYESAANLVERAVQHLDLQNKQVVLTRWVDNLPKETLDTRPWLCVYRAWGYYWTGRRELVESWLQAAENSIETEPKREDAEEDHIRGHIAAVRAHAALTGEDIPRVLEMGQKALDLLPEDDEMRCETAVALGGAYWALGDVVKSEQVFRLAQASALNVGYATMAVPSTCYVGMQQVKQGRLSEAMLTFREGLRMAAGPDGKETPVAGFPNVKLGDVLRERNELEQAREHLLRGVDQCERLGQADVLADAYVCLGRYQLAAGDAEGVHESLEKADQVVHRTKVDPFVLCWLEDCRLKTWLAQGNLEAASRWAERSGLSPDGQLSYHYDLHHQNLARVLVAKGMLAGSSRSLDLAQERLAV